MLWRRAALAALLFCTSSLAAPTLEQDIRFGPNGPPRQRRDTSNSTTNGNSTTDDPTILEPVIPLGLNTGALGNLGLGTNVVLSWAGSANATAARRMMRRDGSGSATPLLKRDNAVSANANFTFQYPTIPLDHSAYVSKVSCTSSTLTGTLTSTAYTYAKSRWANAGKILFVTSVDGCGGDDENYLWLATSVTFNDKTRTFLAKGASTTYKKAGKHVNLKWGKVSSTALVRRGSDKSEMFEPHDLYARRTTLGSISWDLTLSKFENPDLYAPWDNAIRLFNWTKAGGKEDDSFSKGEVKGSNGHHKRSNETGLAVRDVDSREVKSGYEFGLALYCVECGFTGSADVWGELDISIIPPAINTAQAGFDAQFAFDMNFGLAAFVVYKKEWEDELARVDIVGFEIPILFDCGFFVELDLSAEIEISATGTLLLGGGIHYDQIGFVIDFLDSSGSHSTSLPPTYAHTAEATGQLSIEAGIGMPIKLGLGVGFLEDLIDADAAIVDTPSLNIEGVFEVSATVTDDGEIETDINGGCYGIAWSIFFQNLIQLELKATGFDDYDIDLVHPYKSPPLAEGCIGYEDDGTEDDPVKTNNGAGGNGLGGGNGLNGPQPGSNPTPTTGSTTASTTPFAGCKPSQIVDNFTAAVAAGNVCKKLVTQAQVSESNNVGKPMYLVDVTTCADACLKNTKCLSWSLDNNGAAGHGTCQMYVKKTSSIGTVKKKGNPDMTFYDKACWQYKNCKT